MVDGALAAFSLDGSLLWSQPLVPDRPTLGASSFSFELRDSGDLPVVYKGKVLLYGLDGTPQGLFTQPCLWAQNFYPDVAYHPQRGLAVGGQRSMRINGVDTPLAFFDDGGEMSHWLARESLSSNLCFRITRRSKLC